MQKNKKVFGIDISKKTFDVADSMGNHFQFSNNVKHFPEFLKLLDDQSHCVMEATGYLHYQLAYFLVENNIAVSVENPLTVKRFMQMKLTRVKSDKSDAKMICLYGQEQQLSLWVGQSKNQIVCMQMIRLLDFYTKQSTSLKNKIKSEETYGNPSMHVVNSLQRSLQNLQKEAIEVEVALLQLIYTEYQETFTKIKSIPGIGVKTAMMLVVLTDGFKNFESSSQLSSFFGLAPVARRSGSSVRGRARISKMGNSKIRNLLFLCSFTACKSNKACRELYERIIRQGKSKKLALIAVCNKLLKQAFAIAKSQVAYDENHVSRLITSV